MAFLGAPLCLGEGLDWVIGWDLFVWLVVWVLLSGGIWVLAVMNLRV